jgi:hypothetical protein
VCRQLGDRDGEAWCHHLVGHRNLVVSGDAAIGPLQEGRAIFEEIDRPWEIAWSDRFIGDALGMIGRAPEGIELQLDSISRFREMGDLWSTAYGLHHVGALLLTLPDHGPVAARPYYQRCKRLADELGDPVWSAHGLLGLAKCEQLGGTGNAERLYAEVHERLLLMGDDNCLISVLGARGELRSEDGDDRQAASYYAEAIRVASKIGQAFGLTVNLDRVARLVDGRGRRSEARRLVAAVDSALASGAVWYPDSYVAAHRELMGSLSVDADAGEGLEGAVLLALEMAEEITSID